jgi:hypothetical protein
LLELSYFLLLLVSARCVLAQSNPIVVENAKPGNPPSQWDISGSGDPSIQGFATDISVNRGQTIRFKVKTNATNYRLDIYRLGYYGGSGARLVARNVLPTASLPQNQPNPIADSSTGLIDCGVGRIRILARSWRDLRRLRRQTDPPTPAAQATVSFIA